MYLNAVQQKSGGIVLTLDSLDGMYSLLPLFWKGVPMLHWFAGGQGKFEVKSWQNSQAGEWHEDRASVSRRWLAKVRLESEVMVHGGANAGVRVHEPLLKQMIL